MSNGKRQALPSQKGTELWPQITQPPAKLVIHGVPPNTPLYHAVANTFAGPLKAFHAKAQQAYALSTSHIAKSRYNWGPARATYTNVQGQEIITLEVTTTLLQLIEEQIVTSQKDHWDWALIELQVPSVGHLEGVEIAIVKAQRLAPAPGEDGLKFAGYAFDQGAIDGGVTYWSDGLDPFIISFAPHVDPVQTVDAAEGDTQIVSLLVDMRRFPGVPVVIDIYGYLSMGSSDVDQVVGYARSIIPKETVAVIESSILYSGWEHANAGRLFYYSVPGFTPGDPTTDPTDIATPHDAYIAGYTFVPSDAGTITRVAIPSPGMVPVVDGTGASTYELDPTYHSPSHLLLHQTVDDLLLVDSSNPPNFRYDVRRHEVSWAITPITSPVLVPAPAETRNSLVTGVGGFGWPPWVQTLFDANIDWARWDIQTLLPKHLEGSKIGTVVISSNYELGVDEPYKKLGTVLIDPNFKSISFNRAK